MSGPAIASLAGRRSLAVPAGLLVAIFLLVIGGNLAGNGVFGAIAPGGAVALPGWEHGSLLRVLCVWLASWFGFVLDPETALVLVYVGLASIAAVLTYASLRRSNWPAPQAFFALAMVAGHGVLLFSVTMASHEFLLVLAAGILIPACRRLESVGDVQSIINYGLTLPLLLMAGPTLAALIPLLVLAVPFGEAEARQKPSVFAAMLVVAIVPVLIVVVGVWAMAARAGIGFSVLAEPFEAAFLRSSSPILAPTLLMLATAPVALVVLLHMIVPDRRRQFATSMLALFLPLYLLIGNSLFDWQLAPWTPAAMMLATTLGWLSATRLRVWMQWLTLALLALSLMASWLLAGSWAAPAWLGGLLPLRLFSYSMGLPN